MHWDKNKIQAELHPNNEELNFMKATRPMRWLATIFGIMPLQLNAAGEASISFLRLTYGAALNMASAGLRIYVECKVSHTGFFQGVVHYSNLLLPIACIISSVVLSFKLHQMIYFYRKVVNFSNSLPKPVLNKHFYLQILVVFVILMGAIVTNAIHYITVPENFTGIDNLIARLTDTQIMVVLTILKVQFAFALLAAKNMFTEVISAMEALPQSPTAYKPLDMNPWIRLYEQAVHVCQKVNECFGCAMGVITLLAVLDCIISAYFHIVLTEKGQSGIVYLLIMATAIIEEWFVLTACELVMAECTKVATAVHHAMHRATDASSQEQLKQFSLYLLHRKVKLSICGLVPLDYTLLFTIGGTVTTYMIILVQFQKTEKEQ